MTLLEGLGMTLSAARYKNVALAEELSTDDEPDDGVYVDGMIYGSLRRTQGVLRDILLECVTLAETQAATQPEMRIAQ